MSGVHVERVGDNVVICESKDGKTKCYWLRYGDVTHLAMVLGDMGISDCSIIKEIAEKTGVNADDFTAKYCDSKPHPELYGVKPSDNKDETITYKVLLTVRKNEDGTMVVCAGEHNCVRIKSCDPQHLARAIKLLNIRDVASMLGMVNCTGSYSEVMRILRGEGYV